MTVLNPRLRKTLENTIREARIVAEDAARDAIERLGIATQEAPTHLSDEQKALRRRLRAHARSLGDTRNAKGEMTTARLQEAAGYEFWHRMLFGRLLMERNLLLHPEYGVPLSMTDVQEIAAEDKDRFPDEWAVAEHFAAPTLPMIFKPDDPVLALQFDPHFHARLRALLTDLPTEVFAADDSLGWTYQFWRADEKDAVNRSGVKIGAAELPAVTQLFTEPYMVKFLLHNTLGAWWAGKVLAAKPDFARDAEDERALRSGCALSGAAWEYLRFVREDEGKGPWRPAAGSFPEWPQRASEITFCDPCCGSGHFMVEAFAILAALRQAEERLSPEEVVRAVLRDNLHGLEIDGRCVQIAAFNVALAAWKLAGSPISLPAPRIAWVGAPPPMSRSEIVALAGGDVTLGRTMEALYDEFAQAPLLGTLLEIGAKDLLDTDIRDRGKQVLAQVSGGEPEPAEGAVAARGLLDAVALLSRHYVLQATNVPFLGRGRQSEGLAIYVARRMPQAKADLATALLQRMQGMSSAGGTIASVTPQNWLFLGTYKKFRSEVLNRNSLSTVAILGEHGFDTPAAAGAFTALVILTATRPEAATVFAGFDANTAADALAKAAMLSAGQVRVTHQAAQQANPDGRIALGAGTSAKLLSDYANSYKGIATGDLPQFIRRFWEILDRDDRWEFLQEPPTSADRCAPFTSRCGLLLWENGSGRLRAFVAERLGEQGIGAWLRGEPAWGRSGIAVAQMRSLPVSLYSGNFFDESTGVIMRWTPKMRQVAKVEPCP